MRNRGLASQLRARSSTGLIRSSLPDAAPETARHDAPDTRPPITAPTGTHRRRCAAAARPVRLPSRRATALLAGTMLALGVAIGAAIGPAPSASLAGSGAIVGSVVVPYLNELQPGRAGDAHPHPSTLSLRPRQPGNAGATAERRGTSTSSAAPASTVTTTTPPRRPPPRRRRSTLPPITKVWLIELSGSSFTRSPREAGLGAEHRQKIIPSGTLLSGWSALEGSAFASEAGLLAASQATAEATSPVAPDDHRAALPGRRRGRLLRRRHARRAEHGGQLPRADARR